MLVREIIEATNGKLVCGDENLDITGYSKDTRTIQLGEFYIPIVGANFDGHEFIEQAFSKGAIGCITSRQMEAMEGKVIIEVEDTTKALQDMAMYLRLHRNVKVVAITGSVGKTSTKDLVYSVISQKFKALKTIGNYNNEIGVPLTILRMKDEEVLVIEMGMDYAGTISLLSYIARPDICLITNVGTAHIGNLGSRENILKAKLEIIDHIQENGTLVINNDNDMLHTYQGDAIRFGIETDSDLMAKNVKTFEDESIFECEGNAYHIHVPGSHFVLNALAAIAVGKQLGIEPELMKKGIETFELTKKRMDFYFLKNDMILIDGSYNANVDSMKSSIEVLSQYEAKKVAILADMLELGDFSEQLHREVGKVLYDRKIDLVLCVGKESKFIVDSAELNGLKEVYHFKSNEALIEALPKYVVDPKTVILVKGSQSMHLASVVSYIMENYKK